ncbi:hypothetical protein M231_00872 [Tremella mesenterica]|uniref:Uncharacterized protein n=1 Tax=Tremella mesenterica TaxID=5217 RepID=A0A4Q1BUQ9_TREME|nr:hypothetical protein M231_00872 [Tremella mesenterica]
MPSNETTPTTETTSDTPRESSYPPAHHTRSRSIVSAQSSPSVVVYDDTVDRGSDTEGQNLARLRTNRTLRGCWQSAVTIIQSRVDPIGSLVSVLDMPKKRLFWLSLGGAISFLLLRSSFKDPLGALLLGLGSPTKSTVPNYTLITCGPATASINHTHGHGHGLCRCCMVAASYAADRRELTHDNSGLTATLTPSLANYVSGTAISFRESTGCVFLSDEPFIPGENCLEGIIRLAEESKKPKNSITQL